jgi:hypothetical protein
VLFWAFILVAAKTILPIMRNLLFILSLVLFASCSRNMLPTVQNDTKDSTVQTEHTIHTTDTVYVPGDSVEISVAIPCPDAVFNQEVNNTNTKLKVKLKNGQLTVNCKTDSLQKIIDSITTVKRWELHKTITKTITVKEKVIKYKVPAWCWWLLAFFVGSIVYKFRHSIIGLFP